MGYFPILPGGRDRIRTCEAINLLVFKTSAINHSATLPPLILPEDPLFFNPKPFLIDFYAYLWYNKKIHYFGR